MINNLIEAIEAKKLSKYREFICQSTRPAIDIIRRKNVKPSLGCSRFGGKPDLPVGSQWPMRKSVPYRFIGQINFAEIPPSDIGIPSAGLLSLFVLDNCDDDPFWGDDDYVYTVFTQEPNNLETMTSPPNPNLQLDFENPGVAVVEFHHTIDIPFDEYQADNWPFTRDTFDDGLECEAYYELRKSLHKSNDYLLGYPSHCSLAYNPTPGPEWISLLTIDSDDNLEWCWHDGDTLMLFIEKEKLANLDFSKIKADAG